jgi:hypothetical protein
MGKNRKLGRTGSSSFLTPSANASLQPGLWHGALPLFARFCTSSSRSHIAIQATFRAIE